MEYSCEVCGEKIEGDMNVYIDHTERHIVDLIKSKHPDWENKDGLCPKCYDYYKGELKGNNFIE